MSSRCLCALRRFLSLGRLNGHAHVLHIVHARVCYICVRLAFVWRACACVSVCAHVSSSMSAVQCSRPISPSSSRRTRSARGDSPHLLRRVVVGHRLEPRQTSRGCQRDIVRERLLVHLRAAAAVVAAGARRTLANPRPAIRNSKVRLDTTLGAASQVYVCRGASHDHGGRQPLKCGAPHVRMTHKDVTYKLFSPV